ncbi:MAG: murE [Candidatus Saccharibacteria bacterium]|nr:murE [Candidatus Saccharibacteria bacterium]
MNPKKLVRKVLPKQGITAAEEAYRKGRIKLTQARYGYPARGARVIAVTGTNGKTTTCVLINSVLKAGGYKTALITTALTEMDGVATSNTNHRTVPLTADLMKFFKEAKTKGVDFIIMETTSQALHQHKMTGLPVEIAVMTNLTQDHLDYHGSMDAYAAAKARLFNKYMHPGHCVLNRDDEWYDYFAKQAVGTVTTYGQDAASDLQITDLKLTASGNDFTLAVDGDKAAVHTELSGLFNVYNAAAAATVGALLELPDEAIDQGLSGLEAVPGRMEAIKAGQDFEVIVDYAHTPDALKNVLTALKAVSKGKVSIVFGATGDRDKGKRPIMGEVVAGIADHIYLTDDETYTEDPAAIRDAVYAGITKAGGAGKTTIVEDRRDAIAKAFSEAKKGDTVLLAGIGHQDYRAMAGKNIEWDEREVARELLSR